MNCRPSKASKRFGPPPYRRGRPTVTKNDTTRPHATSRDAYTLLHVLLVMTLMGMLLVISTSTLFTLIHAERNVRQQAFYNSTVSRLSRQLRDDVHAAGVAELDPNDDGPETTDRLTLRLPDNRQVWYHIETSRILRTAREGKTILHRESFEAPIRQAVRWELRQMDGHRVVCLVLPRKLATPGTGPSIAKTLRITAVVGYDQRFLASTDED